MGSWLCLVLDYMGAEVTGFSLEEESNSLYEKIKNDFKLGNYYGDLRNIDEIRKCMEISQPDVVFHLAAFGFIKECKNDPFTTFLSNVMGTVNLFEVIKENQSVKDIVVASSDKVYRNDDTATQLFNEEDPLGGIDPYSCSKTCEDLIVQSYYDTYLKNCGKSATILRPSNIVGGGDHNVSRLIPSVICSIENNQEIEIRNPEAVRPWQYILDAVDAYVVTAVKAWNTGTIQIYNIGPTPENIKSVGEIVEILIKSSGKTESVHLAVSDSQSSIEKRYLGLNIEKIKEEIGWEPNKGLEQTLGDTYDFYKQWEHENSYQLCRKYIEKYYE